MRKLLPLLGLLVSLPLSAQVALRQSDAVEVPIGPFFDSTDLASGTWTPETSLTLSQADVLLTKCTAAGDCGSQAQKNETTSCPHVGGGMYKCDLDTTDTNTVGILRIDIQESGTAPVWATFVVVEEAVFDASLAGSAAPLTASGVWTNGTRTLTALDEDDTAMDLNATTIGTVTTATNVTTVNGLASNVITAASIANAAIDAATFAADVDAEVLSYIVDDATRIDASELNADIDSLTFTVAGDVDANTQTIAGSAVSTSTAQIGVNVESINGVAITGDGSGTPFGVSFRQFRRAFPDAEITRAAFRELRDRAFREYVKQQGSAFIEASAR